METVLRDEIKLMLIAGELMATLESLLNYCTNLEVKREAQKRLAELELKYKVLT